MMPPHWIPSATAHLANISASASASYGSEKRSPPPQSSPPIPTPPPAPVSDPDTPLNLSKPKSNASSGSGSAGSSPHAHHAQMNMHGMSEQPVAATTPKLLPPNLVMPRAFLPYAGLPPHLSPLPNVGDRQKLTGQNISNKDGMVSPDKQPHFPIHMYGLQPPPHLTGGKSIRDDSTVGKEEADFMAACHGSKYFLLLNIT